MTINIRQHFEKHNKLPALTEWLGLINSPELGAFNKEDNTKFDRLKILEETVGLPYDKPESINATEVLNNSPAFQEIMRRRANERCAVRLTPFDADKSRLRARGMSLKEYVNVWLPMQNVRFAEYRFDIIPQNTDILYSSILLINEYGILGEIIKGVHWQLTQGIYEKESPITYYFDFEKWFFYSISELGVNGWSRKPEKWNAGIENFIVRKLLWKFNMQTQKNSTKHNFKISFFLFNGHLEIIQINCRLL